MTATAKAKTKFSSRNLNAVYKAPLAKAADNGGGYHSSGRMLVLRSSSSVGRGSVLTARSLTAAAPAPINTPSLRMENNGQDVHVHLVPTGKVGWGTSPENNSSSANERELRGDRSNTSYSSSSQAHRSESNGRQVWDCGPASFASHDHDEQSIQHRAGTAASSTRSFGSSSGVFFGGASTGRWGDDAVEQDIARSDMLRARQRERDFPHLRDQGGASSSDQRTFGGNNNYSSVKDHPRDKRCDHYEPERRSLSAEYSHEDRFPERGYGFDRSRSSSYGNHQNISNLGGYYHPSDARREESNTPIPD
ncbi:hypothetical protein Gpo141_00005355 [Globisporangium polare]